MKTSDAVLSWCLGSAFALLGVSPHVVKAGSGGDPPSVHTLPAGIYTAGSNHMALGAGGAPVLGTMAASNSGNQINYQFYLCDDPACATGRSVGIESISMSSQDADIAVGVGPSGNPVAAYHDAKGGRLRFARCADPNCTSVSVRGVGATPSVGKGIDLAVGSDDIAVMSYSSSTGGSVYLTRCDTPVCAEPLNTQLYAPGSSLGFTALLLDASNNPRIAFVDPNLGIRFVTCVSAFCSQYSAITVGPASNDVGIAMAWSADSPVVAVTSNGLLFYAQPAVRIIECADPQCGSWGIRPCRFNLPSQGASGLHTLPGSLVVGTDHIPLYAIAAPAGWGTFVVHDSPSYSEYRTVANIDGRSSRAHVAMILGADGLPVISYAGWDARRVAKCNTRSCL